MPARCDLQRLPVCAPNDPASRIFAKLSHQFMEGVVLQQRHWKQAQFRIPKGLRKTIDPNQ